MGLRSPSQTRLDAIQNVEEQLPFRSSSREQQMDAARQIQLQQALGGGARGATPTQAQTPLSAAQLAAQMQQAKGQGVITEAQKVAQQNAQLEQQKQTETGLQRQQKLFDKERSLRSAQEQLQQQLYQLDFSTKQRIFDNQMQFQKDELGRTRFNEQQLADYAITKAKTREELLNYEMQAQQASERRMSLLKAAQARIQQELSQSFTQEQQKLTQEQTLRLAEMKQKIKEKIEREQANAKNRASIWAAGGTLVGAAIGTVAPGVGTVAGATIGGGLGSIVGSQV